MIASMGAYTAIDQAAGAGGLGSILGTVATGAIMGGDDGSRSSGSCYWWYFGVGD